MSLRDSTYASGRLHRHSTGNPKPTAAWSGLTNTSRQRSYYLTASMRALLSATYFPGAGPLSKTKPTNRCSGTRGASADTARIPKGLSQPCSCASVGVLRDHDSSQLIAFHLRLPLGDAWVSAAGLTDTQEVGRARRKRSGSCVNLFLKGSPSRSYSFGERN